ncbi:hypothetical protein BDW69DRAFT_45658 [Aspergillus filifer]
MTKSGRQNREARQGLESQVQNFSASTPSLTAQYGAFLGHFSLSSNIKETGVPRPFFHPPTTSSLILLYQAPLPISTSKFSLHLSLSHPRSFSSYPTAAIMKFSALLLLSVVSSAMAQQTIPSLDLDEIHDVETLDLLEATSSIEENSLEKRLKRCTQDSQCGKDNICARFFCVKDHPSLYPKTYCRTNKDCKNNGRCVLHVCAPPKGTSSKDNGNGVHCSGDTCIDGNYTIEADEVPASNAGCKTSADCGGNSRCLAGICLAANRRLTRRSALFEDDKLNARAPQLVCHNDNECHEPGYPGGYCNNGIYVADPPARNVVRDSLGTRRLICHNDQECREPGQPGGYCYNGICIADPSARNVLRDFLESRQLVCHNDQECREPGQPGGYCWNGICIADPPHQV